MMEELRIHDDAARYASGKGVVSTTGTLFDMAWGGAVDCLMSADMPKDEDGQTTESAYVKYRSRCEKRFSESFAQERDRAVREALDEVEKANLVPRAKDAAGANYLLVKAKIRQLREGLK